MTEARPPKVISIADHAPSIWVCPSEDEFRQDLVRLEVLTNGVPLEPQLYSKDNLPRDEDAESVLSVHLEHQLTNDLAFLAAVEEGAQSVAAVCLEEHDHGSGVTLRFAAVDTLNEAVRTFLSFVARKMVQAASINVCEESSEPSIDATQIFDRSVALHRQKILGRLRSSQWNKPKYLSRTHKKSLWQDFSNLIHRVQFLFPKSETGLRDQVTNALTELAAIFQDFDKSCHPSTSEQVSDLCTLVKASFSFCTNSSVKIYHQRLSQLASTPKPTAQISSAIKSLRQIEKIAAYYRIPTTLLSIASSHSDLFRHGITLDFLSPFASTPTSITYETWAKTCHVHPEVQLIMYYDLLLHNNSNHQTPGHNPHPHHLPRLIGTSKLHCYLCYLFIRFHRHFIATNTHGRLYDQWTIPDLAEYSDEMVDRYRGIIKDMHGEVLRELGRENEEEDGRQDGKYRWRQEPMTSRQNLLDLDVDTAYMGKPCQ